MLGAAVPLSAAPRASAAASTNAEPPSTSKSTQTTQEVVRDGHAWRILAIRVEFPLEDPDELTTSGDGTFDMRSLGDAIDDYNLPYDTPPHDGVYFSHHLDALARYYQTVSDGRVHIEYRVLPEHPDSVYTMPERALIYGNGRTPEQIDEKWVSLLKDAVEAADDDVVFSDYNSFLFLHAGLGHETGELNDIRSVFLDPGDLASVGDPVLADGGTFELPDAWIMPEAVNVRGRAGLNGLLAKFFGFQLGLLSLSNTAVGVPGLGGWSLMDVGATRLGFVRIKDELEAGFGFVPPHPMAWSKIQLGWIDPMVVRRDTVVAVVATDRPLSLTAGSEAVARAVVIPISPTEYFLLENRQQRGHSELPEGVALPFGEDEPLWLDQSDIEFSTTLSAQEAGDRTNLAGTGAGVWLGVDEYDAFVPGSGILVWHVDDVAIARGKLVGGINNDRVRPGIALEEADGFRHIGNVFFSLQEFTEGTQEDPFFAGQAPTGDQGSTLFGSGTEPATLTNTGLVPGVEIEVLSELGDTMRVQVTFTRNHPGWPRVVVGGRRVQALTVADGGGDRLMVEDDDGVRLLMGDGSEIWDQPDAVFLAAAPDGRRLFLSTDQSIQAWSVNGDGNDAEQVWSIERPDSITAALYSEQLQLWPGSAALLVAGAEGIIAIDVASGDVLQQWPQAVSTLNTADLDGDGSRELIAASPGGEQGWVVSAIDPVSLWQDDEGRLQPVSGDLDGDGRDELITFSHDGSFHVIAMDPDSGLEITQLGQQLAAGVDEMIPTPSLADVDGDGFLEIVAVVGRTVHAIRAVSGLNQSGFPSAAPVHHEAGDFTLSPVMVDLDGDGRQEILAGGRTGVSGFDDDGVFLPGFPLLTQAPLAVALVLADLDGSGGVEIVGLTQDRVYAWDPVRLMAGYRGVDVGWGQDGFDASGSYSHTRRQAAPVAMPDTDLMPSSRAYCYPNPVGGESRAHLRFFLSAEATVQLEVFDAIGERVDRLSFDANSFTVPAENEIRWSTAGYVSGLYICRLEARAASGEQQHVVVRMAVSR